jgi:hypothetical protein
VVIRGESEEGVLRGGYDEHVPTVLVEVKRGVFNGKW